MPCDVRLEVVIRLVQYLPNTIKVGASVGQQWYIQRMNNELRELFALEGTLRNPRGPRRSDASIARRGSVQVHVSRVSDQAIGSTSIDADTLDGLDSTDFLVIAPAADGRNVVTPAGMS